MQIPIEQRQNNASNGSNQPVYLEYLCNHNIAQPRLASNNYPPQQARFIYSQMNTEMINDEITQNRAALDIQLKKSNKTIQQLPISIETADIIRSASGDSKNESKNGSVPSVDISPQNKEISTKSRKFQPVNENKKQKLF